MTEKNVSRVSILLWMNSDLKIHVKCEEYKLYTSAKWPEHYCPSYGPVLEPHDWHLQMSQEAWSSVVAWMTSFL